MTPSNTAPPTATARGDSDDDSCSIVRPSDSNPATWLLILPVLLWVGGRYAEAEARRR
jgi:hypothetical protein